MAAAEDKAIGWIIMKRRKGHDHDNEICLPEMPNVTPGCWRNYGFYWDRSPFQCANCPGETYWEEAQPHEQGGNFVIHWLQDLHDRCGDVADLTKTRLADKHFPNAVAIRCLQRLHAAVETALQIYEAYDVSKYDTFTDVDGRPLSLDD
jgi:hypothetical protein